MGKYEKKKKKSAARIAVWILVCLIAAAALVLYIMPRVLYRLSGEAEILPDIAPTAPSTATSSLPVGEPLPEVTVAPVVFPAKLEDGRLTLEQLFQFDGINPDCGGEAGNAIAAILVTNSSELFLEEARLTLTLADGHFLDYLVTSLPAGKTAMAFALDNAQLSVDALCQTVDISALWDTQSTVLPEDISVLVEGTTITIQNLSNRDFPGLTIHCRDIFDEAYFGGKSHCYTVDPLPPGGTATLDAADSLLGLVEVVRVEILE